MIQHKRQTFNDGMIRIYRVGDIAAPGDMPKEGLELKETLRFHRRTVGLSRLQTALQEQVQVSDLVRCPYRSTVSSQDIAVLDGLQYRINKVQRPEDIKPSVMDLELGRLEQDYELADN